MRIPIMKPRAVDPQKAIPRMQAVANCRKFSNFGPQVMELESRLAELLGVSSDQVVSTASGTSGLAGAMAVASAESWELPAWTFAATGHAAMTTRAPIRFVDVDPKSWMFEFEETRDIGFGRVVVLPFGAGLRSCWWGDETEVVVDAAASLGSMSEAFPQIPTRTSVVFSLHATKVLGVGEGGFVVFGNRDRAKAFRSWTNFGFEGSRESLSNGTNGKMSEYMAALLHSEIDEWPISAKAWHDARSYVDIASQRLGIELQRSLVGEISPYWITVWPNENVRDHVAGILAAAQVETRKWWGSGLHKMELFSGIPHAGLPTTDSVAESYLGLPFYSEITQSEIEFITSVIAASSL